MIAGKVNAGKPTNELKGEIRAMSAKGFERYIIIYPFPPLPEPFPDEKYSPLPPKTIGGFVERTWAYLTIKKLLDDAKFGTDDENEAKAFRDRALQLSLKVSKIFLKSLSRN